MEGREEIVKTLAMVFAVTIDNNIASEKYPYQRTESLWDDHLRAFESMEASPPLRINEKRSIVLRHLNLLSSGRVGWQDVLTVWKSGTWVSGDHDPRASDPQFREYLRLKEIYDDGQE